MAYSSIAGETCDPVCSETEENPAAAGDKRKPFIWDTAAILAVGETDTTGCKVAKVEMEKKQGESPVEQDKLQWSEALMEEVDSKEGESPALQDKLQGTKNSTSAAAAAATVAEQQQQHHQQQ